MELATGPGGTAAAATAGSPYKIAGQNRFGAGLHHRPEREIPRARNWTNVCCDHALFISFAPADDPKLAVAVFVENGKHGGSTAAPIARKMFDAYLLPDKAAGDKAPALGSAL